MATKLDGSVQVIRVDELLDVGPSKIRNKKLLTDLETDASSGKISVSALESVLIHDNIAEKKIAAINVTYGHINDQGQTIKGLKVFTDNLTVGDDTGVYPIHLIKDTGDARIVAEGITNVEFIAITHSDVAGGDSDFELWRSRGDRATPVIVEDGDSVGSIKTRGYSAAAENIGYSTITEIASEVDGGAWTTAPGGRMVFRIREKDTAFQTEFDILKLLSNKSVVLPDGIKLGIGTELPTELLQLKSGSGISTDIGLEEDGTGWRIRNSQTSANFILSSVTGSFDTFADRFQVSADGGVLMFDLKSGISQGAAGALNDELWVDTADNSIKKGV